MLFLPFVYGYPSSSPRAHCTPNKSVPTLRYTRRPGPIYIYRSMPEGSYRVQFPGFPKIVYSSKSSILLLHFQIKNMMGTGELVNVHVQKSNCTRERTFGRARTTLGSVPTRVGVPVERGGAVEAVLHPIARHPAQRT